MTIALLFSAAMVDCLRNVPAVRKLLLLLVDGLKMSGILKIFSHMWFRNDGCCTGISVLYIIVQWAASVDSAMITWNFSGRMVM